MEINFGVISNVVGIERKKLERLLGYEYRQRKDLRFDFWDVFIFNMYRLGKWGEISKGIEKELLVR